MMSHTCVHTGTHANHTDTHTHEHPLSLVGPLLTHLQANSTSAPQVHLIWGVQPPAHHPAPTCCLHGPTQRPCHPLAEPPPTFGTIQVVEVLLLGEAAGGGWLVRGPGPTCEGDEEGAVIPERGSGSAGEPVALISGVSSRNPCPPQNSLGQDLGSTTKTAPLGLG